MTTTAWCSDPRKHRAFGHHERGPEGPYCTSCRVLAAPSGHAGSEAGKDVEVNTPLAAPNHDEPSTTTSRPDVAVDGAPGPTHDVAPTAPAPSPAPLALTPPSGEPTVAPTGEGPNTPDADWPKRGEKKGSRRTCGHCGRHFLSVHQRQVYCGPPCRKNASGMRRYIREKAARHERYTPRARRKVLTNLIGSDPYRIPRDKESDD